MTRILIYEKRNNRNSFIRFFYVSTYSLKLFSMVIIKVCRDVKVGGVALFLKERKKEREIVREKLDFAFRCVSIFYIDH